MIDVGSDGGLLVVRVVIGALLIGHGTGKLFGWFAGHGPDGTGAYFESLGYSKGRVMATLAGLTETGAGAALAAGLLTPLAAAGIIGVMLNAAVSAHGEAGLWAENEGYEYPLVLSVVVAALAAIGPGAISVDAALGWRLDGLGWGLGAVALGVAAAGAILSTRRPSGAPAAGEQR